MKEGRLTQQTPLFTVRETMNALNLGEDEWKTARVLNKQLSSIVRNMQKGIRIFWDTESHTYTVGKATGRQVDKRLVNYIEDFYGITWHEICQFEVGEIAA